MGCGGACGSQASELTLKLNLRVSRTSRLSRRDGVAYHWYILTKSQLHRGNSLAPRLNRRQDQGWTLPRHCSGNGSLSPRLSPPQGGGGKGLAWGLGTQQVLKQ